MRLAEAQSKSNGDNGYEASNSSRKYNKSVSVACVCDVYFLLY